LKWSKKIDSNILENRKLKTIEKLLGIERTDTISGKESIQEYKAYLLNPQKELLNKILLHNADDILNMYPLWNLSNYLDPISKLALVPRLSLDSKFLYTLKIDGHRLCIKGLYCQPLVSFQAFSDHEVILEKNTFTVNLLTLKLPHPTESIVLIDYTSLKLLAEIQLQPKDCQVIINNSLQLRNIETIIMQILKTV
jgi:hypothetical protein